MMHLILTIILLLIYVKTYSSLMKPCLMKATSSKLLSVATDDKYSSTNFNDFHLNTQRLLTKLDHFNEVKLDSTYQIQSSKFGNNPIEFKCSAYTGTHSIRYLRTIQFTGNNYSVYNLMGVPYIHNQLPILGIDIVSLPTYSIIAIDLQPCQKEHSEGNFIYPTTIDSIYQHYKSILPLSSQLPLEVQPYFSKYALFCRLTTEQYKQFEPIIYQATSDYITIYQQLIDMSSKLRSTITPTTPTTTTTTQSSSSSSTAAYDRLNNSDIHTYESSHSNTTSNSNSSNSHLSLEFLEQRRMNLYNYLTYRILKDPAKGLLTSAFGQEWTEYGLKHVFFPLQ